MPYCSKQRHLSDGPPCLPVGVGPPKYPARLGQVKCSMRAWLHDADSFKNNSRWVDIRWVLKRRLIQTSCSLIVAVGAFCEAYTHQLTTQLKRNRPEFCDCGYQNHME